MQRRLLRIFLVLLLLIAVAVGIIAATFAVPELVEFQDLEVKGLEDQQLKAELHCQIRNDNFFALSAYALDYVVSYHDTVIGTGQMPQLKLPANTVSDLALPADIDLPGVISLHPSLFDRSSAELEVLLSGEFSRLHYRHTVAVTATISPKELISELLDQALAEAQPEFQNIRLTALSPKASQFRCTAVFQNPLAIPYTISAMDLEFSSKGMHEASSGKWSLKAPASVKANGTGKIPVDLEIANLSTGKDLLKGVFKGKIQYYTWGEVTVDLAGLNYPVPITGRFELDPLRQKWGFKNFP
ncbi:MAG: LEA type 2 family protein [Bacteroidota bacterium]